MPIRILIRTTVVPIRILIRTTGITNPGRFAPKPFPPLVVSPPGRFPPGRFPPSRFAPTCRFAPLVVSPPSRFAPIMLKKEYSRGITYITKITAYKQINNVYISLYLLTCYLLWSSGLYSPTRLLALPRPLAGGQGHLLNGLR